MSKEKLLEIVLAPKSELMSLKIGLLVRSTMPLILEYELISDLEVQKLQKEDYSKMIMDMNYPVLRKVDPTKSIDENRDVNGYSRYYAEPQSYKGENYLISSEWYDRSQEDYVRWLKRKVN